MQVAFCQVRRPDPDNVASEKTDFVLRIKYNPCSRLMTLLDYRRRDVLLFEMINENRMLFKLRGSMERNYWTLMDTSGFILDMPKDMKDTLAKKEWSSLQVTNICRKPNLSSNEFNVVIDGEDSDDSALGDEINAAGNGGGMCEYPMIVLSTYDPAKCHVPLKHGSATENGVDGFDSTVQSEGNVNDYNNLKG